MPSTALEPGYSWQEEQAFRGLTWSWARSFDTKNWDLLISISTLKVKLLYSEFIEGLQDDVKTREQWVANCTARSLFGDERLQTQHLLGEAVFKRLDESSAVGYWQASATHRRKLSDGTVVEWIIGSYLDQYYELVDGEWKFSGLKPHTVVTQIGSMSDVFGKFA